MAVTMKWPASCKVVTQQYGVKSARYSKGYHTGIDLGCKAGSPIFAAHDGTVTAAGWAGAYGNAVEIAANDTLSTTYNHMSQVKATKGQTVSAGTVIGYIGSTGNSTGPHLHFEVHINGNDVDPGPYLSGATTVDTASVTTVTPASVLSIPGNVSKAFEVMSEPITWMRIGMVVLGNIFLLIALLGMAKSKVLGKAAVSAVADTAKKVGDTNG